MIYDTHVHGGRVEMGSRGVGGGDGGGDGGGIFHQPASLKPIF